MSSERCRYCARPAGVAVVVLPCGCWWTAGGFVGDVVERGKPTSQHHSAKDYGYAGGLCRGPVRIARTVLREGLCQRCRRLKRRLEGRKP